VESTEDRYIRTQQLIADLRQRADACENPQEQLNLRRSVDSLIRVALALKP
jgi:hypothetical protein